MNTRHEMRKEVLAGNKTEERLRTPAVANRETSMSVDIPRSSLFGYQRVSYFRFVLVEAMHREL